MSRRKRAERRRINPDAKYGSILIAKFINCLMKGGKKTVAERAVYDALEEIAEKLNSDGLEAFEVALKNVQPELEVRSRRVGGATYQVPCPVRPERKIALAFRWLIKAARLRKDKKTMSKRLAAELLDAWNNRGVAVKKREDTHKMAESNRAFAHYNW
jgi:small subunit ribosomal protein S7